MPTHRQFADNPFEGNEFGGTWLSNRFLAQRNTTAPSCTKAATVIGRRSEAICTEQNSVAQDPTYCKSYSRYWVAVPVCFGRGLPPFRCALLKTNAFFRQRAMLNPDCVHYHIPYRMSFELQDLWQAALATHRAEQNVKPCHGHRRR